MAVGMRYKEKVQFYRRLTKYSLFLQELLAVEKISSPFYLKQTKIYSKSQNLEKQRKMSKLWLFRILLKRFLTGLATTSTSLGFLASRGVLGSLKGSIALPEATRVP